MMYVIGIEQDYPNMGSYHVVVHFGPLHSVEAARRAAEMVDEMFRDNPLFSIEERATTQ